MQSKICVVSLTVDFHSTLKCVQGGCHYYMFRKIVPRVYDCVTEAICANVLQTALNKLLELQAGY